MAGDIADEKRDFASVRVFLEKAVKIAPCYMVPGNHERWLGFTDNIKLLMNDCGVITFDTSPVTLGEGIVLYGVDDPLFYPTGEFEQLVRDLSPDGKIYNILLSHRPEYAELYAEAGFDLSLCGHAHGGQVRLPLIMNGLAAPNQGLFPKYAGGEYDIGGNTIIVSRGLMIDSLPRVFNPPEVVVIHLCGKQ